MPNKKSALLFASQILFSFLILELASYLYLTHAQNPLHRVARIIKYDDQLGWKSKEYLSTKFEEAELFTDEQGFRVDAVKHVDSSAAIFDESKKSNKSFAVLGPSSAFGWGVDYSETYGYLAAKQLGATAYNFSQIGYSSIQGLKLWEVLLAKRNNTPEWVVISYGINDLDKFRFLGELGGNDFIFFEKLKSQLKPSLPYLNIETLVRLFKSEAALKFDCAPLISVVQRLDLKDSRQVLKNLINSIKNSGSKPILLNTPYRKPQSNRDYSRLKIEKYYEKMRDYAYQDDCRSAVEELKKAKHLESWRVEQDVIEFNEMLKNLALEEKIAYVDAWTVLWKKTDQTEVFLDPVHPNKLGHRLISEEIISKLREIGD